MVHRDSRAGDIKTIFLYVATTCSAIGEGFDSGWIMAVTVICGATELIPNRYIEAIPGTAPNPPNPGGHLADLGINTGTPNRDIIEVFGKLPAIFFPFGLGPNVTDPSVIFFEKRSKCIQDVTGIGLPNLQRAEKEEFQVVFSVIQEPFLESIISGRYVVSLNGPPLPHFGQGQVCSEEGIHLERSDSPGSPSISLDRGASA